MLSDFTAVLVVILFTIIAFFSAMKNGVLKLLASGFAATLGLIVLFAGLNFGQQFADDSLGMELSAGAAVASTFGIALVAYLIALIVFSLILKLIFNPDSPLHFLVDGFPGAILSLLPSAVMAVFIFTCVRVAGTVQELNYTATLSQANIEDLKRRIPAYPFSANWRNGIEDIPLAAPILDQLDPFSNRLNRNAAALVMIHGSAKFTHFLVDQPETTELVEEPDFEQLRKDKNIREALDKQSRLGLVLDPVLQATADQNEHAEELRDLDLKRILVGFGKTLQPDEPNLQ